MALSATRHKAGMAVLAVMVLLIVLFAVTRVMREANPSVGGGVSAPSGLAGAGPEKETIATPPLGPPDVTDDLKGTREERGAETRALGSLGTQEAVQPPVMLSDTDRLTAEDIKAFGALFKDFKAYDPPESILPALKIWATNGRILRVGDFRGAWFVVNFWASWCPPCVEELPAFDRLARKFQGSRVQAIAISLDSKLDAKGVETFVREKSLGETALYLDSSGEIQKSLGNQGLPLTLIVDPSGGVRWRVMGLGKWGDPAAERFLRLLAREG